MHGCKGRGILIATLTPLPLRSWPTSLIVENAGSRGTVGAIYAIILPSHPPAPLTASDDLDHWFHWFLC